MANVSGPSGTRRSVALGSLDQQQAQVPAQPPAAARSKQVAEMETLYLQQQQQQHQQIRRNSTNSVQPAADFYYQQPTGSQQNGPAYNPQQQAAAALGAGRYAQPAPAGKQQQATLTHPMAHIQEDVNVVFNRLMALEPFRKLHPTVIRNLCSYAFIERIDKGVIVFRQGDDAINWYALLEGSVDVRVSQSGGQKDGVTLCTLGVGTTFGASVTQGKSHSVSVVTSDDCTLLRVRRADFQEIFNEQAHLISDVELTPFCSFTSLNRLSGQASGALNRQHPPKPSLPHPDSQQKLYQQKQPQQPPPTRPTNDRANGLVRGPPRPSGGQAPDEEAAEEEPEEEELEAMGGLGRLEPSELASQLMRVGWVLRTLMLHQCPQLIQNRRVQPYLPAGARRPSRQSGPASGRPKQLVAMASSSSLLPSPSTGGSSSSLIAGPSSSAKAAASAGRKVASYVASSFLRSTKTPVAAAQPLSAAPSLFTSNSFDGVSGQGAETLLPPPPEPVLFRRCMAGAEMVDWLLHLGQASPSASRFVNSRLQAVSMWQALLEQGIVFAFAADAEDQAGQTSRTAAQSTSQFQFCDHQQAYYKFWFDRDGTRQSSGAQEPPQRPSEAELATASESLWRSLKLLSKLAPDASFRLILSKRPEERSQEEVDIVYEELQHLKALSHLTNSVKQELAACVTSEHHAKQNTVIFNQGDPGRSWYIILRGAVNVVIVGKGVVCTLHEGDDFGKLALVNDAPRAATIVTSEPNCYFLRVDKQDFNTILRDVEANTVRLKEHGKEVLILQKVAAKEPAALAGAQSALGSQQLQAGGPQLAGEQVAAGPEGGQQPAASSLPSASQQGVISSALKYMVMAGTAEKMLEHLLETRIDGRAPIGPLMSGAKSNLLQHDQVASFIQCHGDNFLEDFILTHKIFMSTGSLCNELLKQYQCQTKSQLADEQLQLQQQPPAPHLSNSNNSAEQHEQHASLDLDYLVAKKRRVVKFVRCWMLVNREHFFHQRAQMEPFLTTIQQRLKADAAKFTSLQPELKAVERILELHLEEDLESRHSQRWIEDIYGNILPLRRHSGAWELAAQVDAGAYLASLHQRRFELKLSTIQADDEVVFRVYCVDHSFATIKTRVDEKAAEVKQLAARELNLTDKELILVHVKSNGERIIYNDADFNISTSLSVNGRLFVCPLDHIDAISPLPEQDPLQEAYQTAAASAPPSQPPAETQAAAASQSQQQRDSSVSNPAAPPEPQPLSSHLLSSTLTNYQDMRFQMGLSVAKLEEFSSRDVAYCLSQLAWPLLRNMHESELIYTVFGRHNFKQITANLNVFLRHFNEIQYWVVTQICLSSSLSKRVQILRKFIKIAAHCKELQNLNAFFAIIMGLSNMAVARLTQTWERLPNKLKRTFSQFESLIDPSRNHRRYRIFISKMEPPIIPFMPLFLKDMTFAHEGNKTYLENGLINFEKMQMVAQTLRTVRYCKSRPMKLDPSACKFKGSIRTIELFFRDLKIIDNQRTLTQMSHQLEHRKT